MANFGAAFSKLTSKHFTQVKGLHRLSKSLPWLVLAASLVVTYVVWQSERQNAMQDLQIDFDFRVRETHSRIDERMKAYEQILRGTDAVFMASNSVTHQEFRTYVELLHLENNYPGSQGIGYAPIVHPAQQDKHITVMRAVGFPSYAIKPDGRRDTYAPVSYIEPFAGNNRQTMGYDMYSDPVRRAAMELARDTGQAVNTRKVLLPLDADEDPLMQGGFLMFLPVYQKGAPLATMAERRAGIIGWVFAPFRMADLMTGILGELTTEIDIEIHDGDDISDETMLYDPDLSGGGSNPDALFKSRSRINLENNYWTVVIRSLYGFEMRAERGKQNFFAYTGIGASLLLTLITWLLVRSRLRALQAAEELGRELTERKRAEEGLRLAATVVRTVEEAVLVTDHDNLIVAVNPAFTAITGYSAEEVIGKNPRLLSSGLNPPEFYQEMWESLLATDSWRGEIQDRRKSGELYVEWLSIKRVRDESGKLTHHVAVFSDISERKAAEGHMRHLAHHDVLTDLPNRVLFADRLRQGIVQAKRGKAHLALLFIDLDKFKPVNDQFGHAVGDLLLKEAAKRLRLCVRESDTVSRVGGDEFVVLLHAIQVEQNSILVAEKIQHALSQPFELEGHSLRISASIGVAVYPQHGSDEAMLVKNADTAMYHAKADGRNNAKLYQTGMLVSGDTKKLLDE